MVLAAWWCFAPGLMTEWCTKTSVLSSSGVMKPYPLLFLKTITTPVGTARGGLQDGETVRSPWHGGAVVAPGVNPADYMKLDTDAQRTKSV